MLKKLLAYHSDIRLVLATTLFSNIGIFMVIPFLAIYLNNIETISTTDVGIIIGVAFWCQRAGSLFGGLLSDYFHIKKTMLAGLVIRIPGYILVGLTQDFYLLMLACSLIGLGSSIYLPAAKSFLVKKIDNADRVDVLSLRMVFSNIGVAIGPVIGLAVFKISPVILFSSVAIIFFLLLIFNSRLSDTVNDSSQLTSGLADFYLLIKSKLMLSVAFFMFVFVAFYMQLEVTMPMFSSDVFGADMASYLFVCNALIVIFFQMQISGWACKSNTKAPMVIAFLFFAISFMMLDNITHSWFAFFIAIIFFSFAEIIIQIRLDYEATHVNERMIATSFGIMSLAGAFGGLFGSYLGALLYTHGGLGFSGWEIMAGGAIVFSILYLIKPSTLIVR